MTQEHPRKLTITVEESVWLNKGQEIEEILGMSLSPEISIKEEGDQVSIVGGLRLVGEYLLSETSQEEEESLDSSYQDQASFRSIEEVHVSENGKGDLKHFFPIDVTIPLSRIQNLQDIYVEVESFDYDVPEKSCIQLTADISISGMSEADEHQESSEEAKVLQVAEEEEREEQVVDTSFSFEAYQLPTPSQEATDEYRVEVPLDQPQEDETSTVYSDLQRITLAPQAPESQQIESNYEEEVRNDSSDDSYEEQAPQQEREENALYLTSMMSKSEEQFTKWRMCIIQEHESLESIAKRYDVSTSQLIRMNRLEAEQIEAGQILYIPVQA